MANKILMLAGHGGMAHGHYMNSGKLSPQVPPGIYEGEFNRDICRRVAAMEPDNRMVLNPGPYNIPQLERVTLVNSISYRLKRQGHQPILVVIHANASPEPGWSDANGFRLIHSSNASRTSRRIAADLDGKIGAHTEIDRRGPILVRNLTVLYRTSCPAIMLEAGFMTNLSDAEYMASNGGREDISTAVDYTLWSPF